MKKGISPLLAAVILVAIVISIAFIISSAINLMVQRQTSAATETQEASGAMLQIDTSSVVCKNVTQNTWQVEMIVNFLGSTKNATGYKIVLKDANGNLKTGENSGGVLQPGSNVVRINLTSAPATGNIQMIQFSTNSPTLIITYTRDNYGDIGTCEISS